MTKILIAEHDPNDLEMIQYELLQGRIKYIAEVVQTEREYINALKTFIPDIIFSDYTFPSFNGYAAFKIKEQLCPDTPFILISGTFGEEKSIELIKEGVTDFVLKDRIFTLNTKLARALKDAEERKQKNKTEKELLQSETHLAEAQRLAKMGSWDYDIKSGKVTCSEELFNVFGVDKQTCIFTHDLYMGMIDEEDRELVLQTTRDSQGTGKPYALEYRITTPGAEKRIISEHGYGKPDEHGKVTRLFGTAQDITAAKRSEAAIKKAYDEKNAVLESIEDGFFAVDKNSLVTYWNKKAQELLHKKREDVIGKNLHEIFGGGHSNIFYDNYKKASRDNTTVRFEAFSILSDKWFAVSAFASDNGLSVYFKDVTERKNDEEKIKESELRYRSIIEQATDAICIADASMKIIDINLYGCQMLGYSKDEFLRLTINDLFLPEDLKTNPFKIEELRTGKVIRNERRFKCKDGTLIDVEMSGRILADGRFIVFGHDIAERKKAQDKIKESELRYRSLNEQASDAICITDSTLKFIDINPYACETFGYTEKEALQLSLPDILFAEDLAENPIKLRELKLGKTTRNERRLKRKDGTAVHMEVSTKLMEDGRMIMFGHDITARKKAEEKMFKAENRFRVMIEKSTDMKTLSTIDGKMIYSSPSITKVLGYSPEEFCAKFAFHMIHPDDIKGYGEKRKEIMQTPGQSFHNQNRFLHKNGNWIWCEGIVTNMLHEPGVNAMVSNFRDISERKTAEQEEEFNRNNMNALINNTHDLMWSVDRDCRLITSNKPFEEMSMINFGKILTKGSSVLDVSHSLEMENHFKKQYERAFNGETFTETEHFNIPAEFWTEISYFPIRNGNEIMGTACYSRDITERKRSEINLAESEKRYRQIVETAQEGIWMIDENKQTTFANKKLCEMLGYTAAEMLGKDLFYFMDDEGKQLAAISLEILKKSGTDSLDCKFLTKTGNTVWAYLTTSSILDEDGSYVGGLAMVTDITERRKIDESNKFKAELLNTVGQAVIATNMNGIVNFWNKAAENNYGWTSDEAIGKNIIDLTPAKQTKKQAEEIMKKLSLGQTWSGEFIVKRKDRSDFPAYVTNAPIYDQQLQLIGIIGVSSDITERKQIELNLKESNELYKESEILLNELNANLKMHAKELAISNAELEQFAYVASHDLQEPLRMVTSFLTQLERKYGNVIDEKGKKYIDFAVDGAKRMRQIILDLLEYSRAGRNVDNVENIDLNELVEEIQILFSKQIEEKKAVIIVDRLPGLQAHRSPIRQIFQNLVGNALKYTGEDKPVEIHITVKSVKDHWQFAVSDNGIGIEQEYYDKIFIIFQRLHSKEEFSGTGMGLAITKKIIETQGGRIWVESETGKGSTFYFTLLKN